MTESHADGTTETMHEYIALPDGREGGACVCPDCECIDARGCDKGCDCETCHDWDD